MKRKRLISFGGIFKEIRKELQLEDVEDGNLIHVSSEDEELTTGQMIVARWNWERQNYFIDWMNCGIIYLKRVVHGEHQSP